MIWEFIRADHRHPFDFSKYQSTRHKLNLRYPHNFYGRIENTSRTSFPFETRWTKTYGVAGTGGGIRRKWGPTRRDDWGDQQAERRQGITNVSVGHMWIPRGLIRSAGPLIYAIVNPVKLCHKYRLMPPLRPADVITTGPALHNFRSLSSPSLFSQYSSSWSRVPEERVLVSAVYLVSRQQRQRDVHNARIARPFFFPLGSRCAHIRAPEIPNHPFTLPFYLFPPAVEQTLSRFKSITHSWEMITTVLQVWEAAARVYNLRLNIKR